MTDSGSRREATYVRAPSCLYPGLHHGLCHILFQSLPYMYLYRAAVIIRASSASAHLPMRNIHFSELHTTGNTLDPRRSTTRRGSSVLCVYYLQAKPGRVQVCNAIRQVSRYCQMRATSPIITECTSVFRMARPLNHLMGTYSVLPYPVCTQQVCVCPTASYM